MKYILSDKAILAFSIYPGLKAEISILLSLSENSINRLIRENNESINGDLTKVAVIKKLEAVTGLSEKKLLREIAITKQQTAA
jgi:hypothetical protein